MIFFKKDSTGFSIIRKGNWKTIKFEEIFFLYAYSTIWR